MSTSRSPSPGPHDHMVPFRWTPVTEATKAVVIMIHGFSSSPEEDFPVYQHVFREVGGEKQQVSVIGLRAQDQCWFPMTWNAPLSDQEPYLSSALGVLEKAITECGVPTSQILLLGFSQGAALALTYAMRHSHRLGGIMALSGCLIGDPSEYPATEGKSLSQTPIYLAWGDRDPYYKVARTERDIVALESRGAKVRLELFPGMGHYVTAREVDHLEDMLKEIVGHETQAPDAGLVDAEEEDMDLHDSR